MENVIDFKKDYKCIAPFKEMAAYEALWSKDNVSFKKIAELFFNHPNSFPSYFISEEEIRHHAMLLVKNIFKEISPRILINHTFDYPKKLRDAKHPLEILYYSGNLDYLDTRCVAIVGARRPSKEGLMRTKKLVKLLVNDDFTIVSGLAEGIDTQAHTTTLEAEGRTIAVIGTPLSEYYPRQNKDLQKYIANNHLLVSQVPFIRYSKQDYRWNRVFFPERNKTMSALTEGTIIIEASDTSGTLIQARAALEQRRKLFILQNCFENKDITWPAKFEKLGAIRVREYEDIISNLGYSEKVTRN